MSAGQVYYVVSTAFDAWCASSLSGTPLPTITCSGATITNRKNEAKAGVRITVYEVVPTKSATLSVSQKAQSDAGKTTAEAIAILRVK